jgi:UDP-N-acetyl-D-glucosamine dehydrogenase
MCVPTPLGEHREPDLRFIIDNARSIAASLRPGQLVILESTTYPGTTDEILRPALEESGLKCGEDFFLAFSPEREDPGNTQFTTVNVPKIIGGVDEISGHLAAAFFGRVVERVVPVGNARIAEATKLTENIFRAVNIALVNELKIIYERMGIDVWDVLDAAETKPFGFMRFDPGPGWGGHCIPVDPFYLSWKARANGQTTHFIERAGEVNINMPQWIIGQLQRKLNERRLALNASRILILGMAYKKNVDDTRESPALEILELLYEQGAEVDYHDPFVPVVPRTRKHADKAGLHSVELTPESIAVYDAVLIVTDHDQVDYPMLAANARLVLDSRGVYHRRFAHLKDRVVSV